MAKMKESKKNRTDAKGIVLVTVVLTNAEGERVKGNLTRTFRVNAATVSAVASEIEQNFRKPDLYELYE
jgi:hypothetical protein